MDVDQFLNPISELTTYQKLLQQLKQGEPGSNVALPRAARLPVVAALHRDLQKTIVLISDRADRALTLLDELGLWAPQARRFYFPEPNPLFYENSAWGPTTRRDRLLVLSELAARQIPGSSRSEIPPLIVASARAIMTRTFPRRDFIKSTQIIKYGQVFQLDKLIHDWINLGYEPVSIVTEPGQFARRGGLLDLWPPADSLPARVEFFGDEIDTLRRFDPTTQRTQQNIERLLVTPAREYLLPKQLPQDLVDVEDFSEFYIPKLHPTSASILDYLPKDAIIMVDDYQALVDTINDVEEQALGLRQDAVQNGNLSPNFPIPFLTKDQILDSLELQSHLILGPYSAVEDLGEDMLRAAFSPGPRYGGRLKPMFEEISQQVTLGDKIVMVSRQASRLEEIWRDIETSPNTHSVQNQPLFVHASLAEGWVLTPQSEKNGHENGLLRLLTDGEIFGWQRPIPRKRSRPVAESPESIYADLQIGDLVVHVDHGIGIFMGLVQRTIEGIANEYLCLEYAEGDQLFVPVFQADRITPYVGPDHRTPTLTRLGGTDWRSAKSRVKEAVQEIAEDLLELYAMRYIVPGYSFGSDTVWMQELEASFPYVETEDQLRVLKEVKQDMESPRPMDRLICGDVGYGKTEIALRSAFKAVLDGKQVLMLVPTTVLAQQHYETFKERLAPFPVEIEMLSRFRSTQEQKRIIKMLSDGTMDIVIGTHRLLSSDIKVKDLGLLIIDEEQRFGVTHKETLKTMRAEVDVLTLTATPIPRTLYMALTGVRDISTLNTPPAERLPVITHVGPYNPRQVRQAILRELERGGQVFFVHNRVQTIGGMRLHLEKLVPEARITVAHGQMNEQELSNRMREFNDGEIDVLLSTSIIESGLDIPNANTLIIDRADTFGLAQLYQLRGRVGRGAQRAYAYFFRHKKLAPTPEGHMRLETIAENTQLGAGLNIAMRDLEIRGAGDLLGTRQHGHIASVGFHLYTRLLADAVRRIQSDKNIQYIEPKSTKAFPELAQELQRPIVNVDLPLSVSIPENYVGDKNVRLRLYRRIANLRTLKEIGELSAEFTDRFGPPPQSVQNLLYQLKVKLLVEQAEAFNVSAEGKVIAIRYPPLPDDRTQRNFPYLGSDVRVGRNGLWFEYQAHEDWQNRLTQILEELVAFQTENKPK